MKIFILMMAGILNASLNSLSLAATFHDAIGRTVTLESPPQRIVCLAPNLTEIVYYIGLGDRIAGVTNFSYYPPQAAQKPRIGTYVNLNAEKIIDLAPDLAIGTADGNSRGIVRLLDQAKIPVYIVNPRNVMNIIDAIASLGKVLGVEKKARELSEQLRNQVHAVAEKTKGIKRPLVFLQINLKPIITVNKNTFHNDLIRLAGGRNMEEDRANTYPRISIEEVIRRRPEIIIISSMEQGGRFENAKKEWMKWTNIPAVKNGRVYLMASDLLDRPSPRMIEGLKILAKLIHPEIEWAP
jgi:iron complex transport system substrate-binding protein